MAFCLTRRGFIFTLENFEKKIVERNMPKRHVLFTRREWIQTELNLCILSLVSDRAYTPKFWKILKIVVDLKNSECQFIWDIKMHNFESFVQRPQNRLVLFVLAFFCMVQIITIVRGISSVHWNKY